MSRQWVERQRVAQLAAKNRHAKTCQRRAGRQLCGGVLCDHVDALGRVVRDCEHCARRWKGLCRHCPCPVEGRVGQALRCARCKAVHNRRYNTAYAQHHAERHRDQSRESHRRRSGFYEQRGLVPAAVGTVGIPALTRTEVARTAARARDHHIHRVA